MIRPDACRLEPALLGLTPTPATSSNVVHVHHGLANARTAFERADYLTVVRTLPRVAGAADATHGNTCHGNDILAYGQSGTVVPSRMPQS
ncbi:hypothetical protein [Kibdelosporangium aridum]|uniref:Uncharacterized protein n=1 Tax=Kibdelosporangium aridum TaxID=2030 RepID=A0A1W2G0R3_KIBAR|nr:hypothetical protein [Kibdelosporangium aridum]SMD27624.1 hypothetical protein SAMN05661093_11234 [Kibdelosporangium aridum]